MKRPRKRPKKTREPSLFYKSTRNRQGGPPIHPKLRKCPFCSTYLPDKDFEIHSRSHPRQLQDLAPTPESDTDLQRMWKGRFLGFDVSSMPMTQLRNKIRAANALFPKGSNLRHWITSQTGNKGGKELRLKIIDLVQSDWT